MKIVGAVLVLAGCIALGVHKSGRYLCRLNNLYAIRTVFHRIQSEIRYLNTPLPELMEKMAASMGEPLRGFFSEVAGELEKRSRGELETIWQTAMEHHLSKELEQEGWEELQQMGGRLGCLDARSQEQTIGFFLQRWEHLIERGEKEKNVKLKLYYTCGVMGGLLVILILV